MASKSLPMDAGLMDLLFIGAIAGLAGGLVNILFWQQTIRKNKILGIKIHEGFTKSIADSFANSDIGSGSINIKEIEKNVLALFDDFMSNKLTEKMPVLSMFIDDKLISEIRAIFHQEMEISLPRLLKENIKGQINTDSIANIFDKTIIGVLNKYRWHGVVYLLIGAITGAGIGLIFYLILSNT